jgi:Nucleotidyl transferase AbiEii toxin, Type IV TA system
MGALVPKLNILPESQQLLWKLLGSTPQDFVLYGGTALALRLGHRQSVDFDFFSSRTFQPMVLARSIPYLNGQTITQQAADTLSCEVLTAGGPVKISFFGGISLGQIEAPDIVESNGVAVASLTDIFGMKCGTVPQRNETKDYLDIHALIQAGINLSRGMASAAAIYGNQYNPLLSLQALMYFKDLPEPLPEKVKEDLVSAVKSVSLENLPTITASRTIGERPS